MPSCAEGGVLGILPGTIGTIAGHRSDQADPGHRRADDRAHDAVRCAGDDASTTIKLRKNPNCPVCGEHPTVTQLIDYEQFCGVPAHDRSVFKEKNVQFQVKSITVGELKARREAGDDLVLLDVRDPHEWEISSISEELRIPKSQVMARATEIPRDKEVVVYCRTGVRSRDLIVALQNQGFTNLVNLKGGITAWAREVDPSLPISTD